MLILCLHEQTYKYYKYVTNVWAHCYGDLRFTHGNANVCMCNRANAHVHSQRNMTPRRRVNAITHLNCYRRHLRSSVVAHGCSRLPTVAHGRNVQPQPEHRVLRCSDCNSSRWLYQESPTARGADRAVGLLLRRVHYDATSRATGRPSTAYAVPKAEARRGSCSIAW